MLLGFWLISRFPFGSAVNVCERQESREIQDQAKANQKWCSTYNSPNNNTNCQWPTCNLKIDLYYKNDYKKMSPTMDACTGFKR
jgi:hypothetical protein